MAINVSNRLIPEQKVLVLKQVAEDLGDILGIIPLGVEYHEPDEIIIKRGNMDIVSFLTSTNMKSIIRHIAVVSRNIWRAKNNQDADIYDSQTFAATYMMLFTDLPEEEIEFQKPLSDTQRKINAEIRFQWKILQGFGKTSLYIDQWIDSVRDTSRIFGYAVQEMIN